MGRTVSDKRQRLVAAALSQFREHGVGASSLADIARAANIAPGNVFYHFATKDALAAAVIDTWTARIEQFLGGFMDSDDPWHRVRAYLASAEGRRENYTAFGCPLAALARDLSGGSLARTAAGPLLLQKRWLFDQFQLAGLNREIADGHAQFVLAGLQGAYALAHASADPAAVTATVEHLLAWLDDLQRVR